MEEMPVLNVPDTEEKQDFIITHDIPEESEAVVPKPKCQPKVEVPVVEDDSDEFDLSDITATPKSQSREDIIAAAEAAAYE